LRVDARLAQLAFFSAIPDFPLFFHKPVLRLKSKSGAPLLLV
jgi:hypothetical protein